MDTLLYYSFVTLASLGYGDITPLRRWHVRWPVWKRLAASYTSQFWLDW